VARDSSTNLLGSDPPSSTTRETRTLTIGANTREKSAVVCHPCIHLVLHELEGRESIERQKNGEGNKGIESSADGLGALVSMPIGRDRPKGLLTLSNCQSVGLRNSGYLKREAVETLSPIQ
jgi:hypothetical protein